MKARPANAPEGGAPPGIDRVVHEPARYLIMAHLAVVESADFVFLLYQTGLTKGNLSSHLQKLEQAGYISIDKKFVERIPRTLLSLTPAGHQALADYREQMKRMLKAPRHSP